MERARPISTTPRVTSKTTACSTWPRTTTSPGSKRPRGRAIKIISYLVRHLPPDNNYKVLFMTRDMDEVLASQAKMLERRGEGNEADDDQMRQLFESDLWRTRYFIKHNRNVEALEVAYSDVLADPESQARRVAAFLGGERDVEAMASVVDPSLYRNRA